MTDERLRDIAQFYNEIEATAGVCNFIKNSNGFYLSSGSQKQSVPSLLQYKIKKCVEEHFKELKEKQKEL